MIFAKIVNNNNITALFGCFFWNSTSNFIAKSEVALQIFIQKKCGIND